MNKNKLPVILFDVNETLLDMAPLKKKINSLLNSSKGFRIWFGMLTIKNTEFPFYIFDETRQTGKTFNERLLSAIVIIIQKLS
jgi:hypothetical protein